MAGQLNFTQIYSLEVIKPSLSHPSVEKLFCTGKKHLAMMTEIPSCILSQYLCTMGIFNFQASIQFSRFSEKNIVSQLLHNNGSIKKWREFKR